MIKNAKFFQGHLDGGGEGVSLLCSLKFSAARNSEKQAWYIKIFYVQIFHIQMFSITVKK